MSFKISKADAKDIIAQSKEMIKVCEIDLKISKEAIRKSNINLTTATAIIKYLGGK